MCIVFDDICVLKHTQYNFFSELKFFLHENIDNETFKYSKLHKK